MNKAIPTQYRGTNFRSRLEARWASFFDQCGFQWEYEPFDLDGWIPDFHISGKTGSLLVEVKPIDKFDQATADKIERATKGEHEVILVGFKIDLDPGFFVQIGWFAEQPYNMDEGVKDAHPYWWQGAMLGSANGSIDILDIGPDEGSFYGRLNGEYDGNPMYLGDLERHAILARWAKAGNKTQWKPVSPKVYA